MRRVVFVMAAMLGAICAFLAGITTANREDRRLEKIRRQGDFSDIFGFSCQMGPTSFTQAEVDQIRTVLAQEYGRFTNNKAALPYFHSVPNIGNIDPSASLRHAANLAALFLEQQPDELALQAKADYSQNVYPAPSLSVSS